MLLAVREQLLEHLARIEKRVMELAPNPKPFLVVSNEVRRATPMARAAEIPQCPCIRDGETPCANGLECPDRVA